ncbi:hypothetical protein SERLA73DRAFT_176806 [Serpula lacrymans var. lacrymans S7.3]|uniref:Uncharacterized protein n=1 Tax=Serpula lacrymans var. lacrymans (strain S7.3) TaxID=936435 RepID=F8PQ35_SERL3|nr:hypothetical protein SERLA73DRAFT_176806 [Serpula lacrymans var. lacrymans S7.3]
MNGFVIKPSQENRSFINASFFIPHSSFIHASFRLASQRTHPSSRIKDSGSYTRRTPIPTKHLFFFLCLLHSQLYTWDLGVGALKGDRR